MSDVSCPRCGDSFRLPTADIPPGASARCPWCGETLPVAQLLASLPPVAEVFGADGQSVAATAAGLELDEDSMGLDAYSESAAEGPFDFTDRPADQGFDQHDPSQLELSALEYGEPAEPRPLSEVSDVTFGRDHQRAGTRGRAKKKSSSIRSILGIAVGGLMAFPLAAIILGLLGKPLDLGFWPFDGQTIATGTSARTAAPLVASDGSQEPPQRPVAPQPDRSLAYDLQRQPGGNGVIQADHDSLYPPPSGATANDDGRDAENPLLADAGDQDRAGSPLQVPGSRAAGPEWVEPLAVDEVTEESEQPLPVAEQQVEPQQPMLETSDSSSAEVETPEPETLPSETPELQTPGLDMPSVDNENAVSQPDDPPSIQAATVADPDETVAEPEATVTEPDATEADPEATLAEPEATVTEPTETLADPDATAIAEVEVAESMDPPPAGDEEASEAPLTQPQAASPQLQAALELADESLAAVREYDRAAGPAGLKRHLATLYADVAAVAVAAEQQDEAVVSGLIDRLKASGLVKDLAPAAPNWLKYSKRPNDGMLAVGALRQENDKWFVDWSGAVPLEVRSIGAAPPEAGTQVLVLGRIVNAEPSAPALELVHFEPLE